MYLCFCCLFICDFGVFLLGVCCLLLVWLFLCWPCVCLCWFFNIVGCDWCEGELFEFGWFVSCCVCCVMVLLAVILWIVVYCCNSVVWCVYYYNLFYLINLYLLLWCYCWLFLLFVVCGCLFYLECFLLWFMICCLCYWLYLFVVCCLGVWFVVTLFR